MGTLWLVVCAAEDVSALWAYRRLERAGLSPLHLIEQSTVTAPLVLRHRVGVGGTSTVLQLATGLEIDSREVRGVLNRTTMLGTDHLARVDPVDREYSLAETYAVFLSWLSGLTCPVVNRPTPTGTAGPLVHPSVLALWGWQCGFAPPPFEMGSQITGHIHPAGVADGVAPRHNGVTEVLVVGDHVLPAELPLDVRDACLCLARRADVALLGIALRAGVERWELLAGTTLPDLRTGGDAGARALAGLLTSGSGA